MRYIILVSIVTLVLGRPENGYRYQLQSVSTKDRDTVPCCQRLAQLQKNSLSQGAYSNLRTTHAEVSSDNYKSLPTKIIVQRPSSQGYPSSAVRNGYYAQQSGSETNGASSEHSNGYTSSSGAVSAGSTASVKSTSELENSSSGISTAASSATYPSNYVSQSAINDHSSSASSQVHASSQVRASSANAYDPSASTSYAPSNLNSGAYPSYTSSYPYGNDELIGSASSGSYSATSLRGQSTDQFSPANHKALIQKHIYVHVPPQDNEDAIMRAKYEALMTPKKHYKIIFIKTPTPPNFPTAQLIANAGQQEEKTLVYVLVRKPEEPSVADIRAAQAGIQPNKPEVYFIKYKTKEAPAEENLYSNAVANDGYAYNSNSFSNNGISITTESSYSGYPPSPPQNV